MKGGGGTDRGQHERTSLLHLGKHRRGPLCSLIIRTLLLNLTSPLDRDREREGAEEPEQEDR